MNDPLQAFMIKHRPQVKIPVDEWSRLEQRCARPPRRVRSTWIYVSIATLTAVAVLAIIRFGDRRELESNLDSEDLFSIERGENTDSGAYSDWMWLADQVPSD